MKVATSLVGAAAFAGIVLAAVPASAMPNGLPTHVQTSNVDQVRWVCGPYRCWWRPNFYRAYGFYGPPRFYRHHWGWRRGWHHGWRHRW
jgi:hypothetical protein